ncbi:MAG: hypothetical protein KF883_01720 [Thermomicrobiales bacterium]|nr:hypothetical protein [Thermomicrobiales bacterium]
MPLRDVRLPLVIVAAICLGSVTAPGIRAQTPAAAHCDVAPRTIEELTAILATPVPAGGSPVAFSAPAGLPVDDDVAKEIEATIAHLFACLNAGETLRAYALYSDDYLHHILATQSPTELTALATPRPVDTDEHTIVLGVENPQRLPDGRVYATVILDPALIPVQKRFGFFLVKQDGRWLIDDVLDELEFSLP